jgi:hypothetical protein
MSVQPAYHLPVEHPFPVEHPPRFVADGCLVAATAGETFEVGDPVKLRCDPMVLLDE